MHGAAKTFRLARCVVERAIWARTWLLHADKVIYYLWTLEQFAYQLCLKGFIAQEEKSHPFRAMSARKTRHSVSRPSAWHRGPSRQWKLLVPLLLSLKAKPWIGWFTLQSCTGWVLRYRSDADLKVVQERLFLAWRTVQEWSLDSHRSADSTMVEIVPAFLFLHNISLGLRTTGLSTKWILL